MEFVLGTLKDLYT